MTSGKISMRNGCAALILIYICNSLIMGFPSGVGTDTWIAVLGSVVFVVPLMLLYARLIHLMPGKNIFDMFKTVFGKVTAIIISVFYAFYFLMLTGVIRGNYAQFVHLTSLPETSYITVCCAFFLVCTYLAQSGEANLTKWCVMMLALAALVFSLLFMMSLSRISLDNLLPVMEHSVAEIAGTSLKFVPLPMGEAILLMTMVDKLEKSVNPYKLFIIGSLVAILFFVVLFFQCCGVLGEDMLKNTYFSTYKAASVLHIGSIGTRIESIVAFVFTLAGISKVSTGVIASSKAISQVFTIKSYHRVLVAASFFTVAISVIGHKNIVEMFDFIEVYVYYAQPFQVIFPLALWIGAEIKARRGSIPRQTVWKETEAQSPDMPNDPAKGTVST